jgi:hypothetical protein
MEIATAAIDERSLPASRPEDLAAAMNSVEFRLVIRPRGPLSRQCPVDSIGQSVRDIHP